MDHGHNPKLRLGVTLEAASSFSPGIANGPPLPVVDYGLVGKQAPRLLPTPPAGTLPRASER